MEFLRIKKKQRATRVGSRQGQFSTTRQRPTRPEKDT